MGIDLDLAAGWGQRYDDGETTDPEDVADPHTDRDESQQSLTERTVRFRWWATIVGGLVVFFVIWLGFIATNLIPSLLTNQWTHRLVAATGLFVAGHRMGWGKRRSAAEETDELVLKEAHRVRRFRGEFLPNQGSAPKFKAYKGLRNLWPFASQEPYRVGDIADDVATLRSRPDTDPNDPALIRLDQGARADDRMLSVTETATGTVVTVLTGELDATRGAHTTELRTTIPEIAHEDDLVDLEQALEEQREEAEMARQQKQVAEHQRDQAIEAAKQAREEELQQFIDSYTKIEEARGRSRGRSADDSGGEVEGPLSDVESAMNGGLDDE